jgi:S1-C subfamily serine protease
VRAGVRAASLVLCAAALAGCATPPSETYVPPPLPALPQVEIPELRVDSTERQIRRAVLRIRAVGCGGTVTGTGFLIGERTVLTNRHVIEDSFRLELITWDGVILTAGSAAYSLQDDLAVVTLDTAPPAGVTLALHPSVVGSGTNITVVGYPRATLQTIEHGTIARLSGQYPERSLVQVLTAPIRPGNSGGPVIDAAGRVVGVVYATDTESGEGLAIEMNATRYTELDLVEHTPVACAATTDR